MSIERDIGKLTKQLAAIANIDAQRSGAFALNRTAARIKTQVVRAVSRELGIPAKHVRKRVFTSRATVKRQRAKVRAYRRAIPVISLGNVSTVTRGKNRGVLRVGNKSYPGAFINQVGTNGTWQALKRKGRARYPIEVLKIPLQKAVDAHTYPIAKRVMKSDYPNILKNDLNFRLNKRLKK